MRVRQRHIHFSGACGRALGPLAADLMLAGESISASDAVRYAPMDAFLKKAGLRISGRFSARNVPPETSLLVKGADVDDANVEARAALGRGVPVCNMAQLIGQHLTRGSRRLVVAGTKGKTTTTAMLAWILEQCGRKPDYLIGGLCPHFQLPVRMRGARWAVLEGDEYPAGRDDRTAKFHYYRPHGLILTNVRLDHADIYPTLGRVKAEFQRLCSSLPTGGFLIVNAECRNAMSLREHTTARVESVGWSADADHRIHRLKSTAAGTQFTFCEQAFNLRATGRVFALDAALASLAALQTGVSLARSAAALAGFDGVRGRMQSMASTPGIELVWDETYHPLALAENLAAIKQRLPGRRLLVLLQPRHTGGLNGFQSKQLPSALRSADKVLLCKPFDVAEFPGGPFSNQDLAAALRQRGVKVALKPKNLPIVDFCLRHARRGDVVYCGLAAGSEFIVTPLVSGLLDRFSP